MKSSPSHSGPQYAWKGQRQSLLNIQNYYQNKGRNSQKKKKIKDEGEKYVDMNYYNRIFLYDPYPTY